MSGCINGFKWHDRLTKAAELNINWNAKFQANYSRLQNWGDWVQSTVYAEEAAGITPQSVSFANQKGHKTGIQMVHKALFGNVSIIAYIPWISKGKLYTKLAGVCRVNETLLVHLEWFLIDGGKKSQT